MFKSLKTNAALIFAAAAVMTAPAAAQTASNGSLLGGGLKEKYDASEISSILGEFQIQTQLQPYENDDSATLVAVTSGGAQFFFSMFNCNDASTGAGCSQFMLFTGISNAGMSYETLNAFNVNSDVTKAMNMGDQQIVLFAASVIANGGIGRDNVKMITALFLNDMQKFVDGQDVQQSVSLLLSDTLKKPDGSSKLANETAGAGLNQNVSALSVTAERALTAAVTNTYNVEFGSDSVESMID